MKASCAVLLMFFAAAAAAEKLNPLGATIKLMDDLTAKLEKETAAATKAATEYAAWCKEKITDLGFDIETGLASKEEITATIVKMTANIEATSTKITTVASSISTDDADLQAAEGVRAKEEATFKASEAELLDSIEVLTRAFNILQREMAKNPAVLMQVDTSNVEKMLKSLTAVIDAAAFPSGDQSKLVALVQAQSGADADDEELDAPAAAAYKTHSTSILDVIEDLKEKAEAELADLRKAEQAAKQNFLLLKQSLTDSMQADTKVMVEAKSFKASYSETKFSSKGDLAVVIKTLKEDTETKASTEEKCAQVAADHEASMKGRAEELAAVAEAKKILLEMTGPAADRAYSLLQVSTSTKASSHAAMANVEIVNLVKKLAKEHHSAALAQLASRVATVFRYGVQAGANPFAKVKDLISDLIAKLEKEASEEASEKAFCEEEMSKTDAKKSDLESELSSLTSKIDTATAKSTKLKGQVKQLQADLAELAKVQAEATTLRQETHAEYLESKADFEAGLSGVRKAITVLKDYYGSAAFIQQPAAPESYSKSTGKGNSIIDILEVAESDFAENLAKGETEESDAAAAYEKGTQEYELTKSTKEQDVKYMEKEYKALDKSVVQISSDKESTSTELAAVLEYDAKLKERCVAKPESYESRKAAREAEIAGLKEALKILETETAFMQRRKRMHKHGFLTAL